MTFELDNVHIMFFLKNFQIREFANHLIFRLYNPNNFQK